ncbi:MAG: right-handed parallel beta-helix repeat-containing protein [Verrucomicrobia bacterium]|nr:right-handed parallel beta-helix repeat-containing protein [Verrucomicrobiota bacterium]
MNHPIKPLVVCSLVVACHTARVDSATTDGSFEAWQRHRDAMAADDSLARFYTFENVDGGTVPAAGAVAPLSFKLQPKAGVPAEQLRVIEGRWPQKKAVRLDQGYLAAEPFAVTKKLFTAAAWVKLNGPGVHRGNNESTNGTLLSVGTGYWDGWRLTVNYPLRTLGFEIGRPKPSHSIGIHASAAVSDSVWHHLAVSWDGREMHIYVDGVLAASGPYDGDYTPPPQSGQFRVGYANHGLGSVVLDVDEVAIYSRALTTAEILRAVEFCGPQAPGARRNLARLCRERKDFAGAREHYRALLESPSLDSCDRLNALFDLGQLCWQARDLGGARAAYAQVVAAKDAPAHYRSVAQLRIAASHAQQKDYAAAKAELAKIAAMADAPPHHKREAAERTKELERIEQGQPVRDPAASRMPPPKWPTPAVTLFVSPKGDDKNPGTKDQPFATLERARDEIRKLRKSNVTVCVRGGEYAVKQTFKLTAEDSGTEQAPIVYAAFDKETPRFTGGVRVSGFTRVTDPAVLARLPEESRGKVWQAELKAQGISDLSAFAPKGTYGARPRKPMLELFFDGKPMEIARWPNDRFVMTGEVLGPQQADKRGRPHSVGGQFIYDSDRPVRWKDESDAWLYGYWFHDWADSYEKIASIDTAQRLITLAPPLHNYGFAKNHRYFALNLLSEIDRPGEWYLDRSRGVLYFWPSSNPDRGRSGWMWWLKQSPDYYPRLTSENYPVEISMFAAPFVELDGVAHVTFRGLTWETGRDDGLRIKGGERCLLAGCTVRNFAGDGVTVEGGKGHGLLGCDIYGMGRGGTILRGGDRKTLMPCGHFVENCDIHHLSRIDHTYTPAVLANGVGIRIAHNRMHHIGSSAMRVEGNNHLVEFNEVHHVVLESDDQGGVDVFGNPTYRGVVYRHNFFHHIGSGRSCGSAGIRLDDAISGTLIYGNIFWRCADGNFGGVQIHGGKDNIVDNNLFVDCKQAISFSPWGQKRWEQFLGEPMAAGALKQVDITQPPYSTRYPELAALRENADANHIWRNLAVRCGKFAVRDRGVNEFMGNQEAGSNSGFANAVKGDFRLKPSAAAAIGFAPIPFDEIGLYRDDLCKRLP